MAFGFCAILLYFCSYVIVDVMKHELNGFSSHTTAMAGWYTKPNIIGTMLPEQGQNPRTREGARASILPLETLS